MSTIDGAYSTSSFGALGTLVADSAALKRQLDTLNAQAGSGRVADTYAGLGAGARVSLDLRPAVENVHGWQANIDAATLRMDVTRSAMTAIQQVASDLRTQLDGLNGLNPEQVDMVAANARSALVQVGSLLNSQAAGVYVFAGQDTANPPVPNADTLTSSGFFTQIAAAVGALSPNGAAATVASTLAIAQSNVAGTSPFSTYLSQPASNLATPEAEVGLRRTIGTGMLASANVAVTSQGGSTTGSYMRDLLRALATVGSLRSTQVDTPGFSDLVQDVRTGVTDAIAAMAGDVGVMGDRQSSLTDIRSHLDETEVSLSRQLGSVESVDMAETLSRLSLVQTQLQASYQLINGVNGLSLIKFLGTA
ncbi:MAG: flagellin [Acetobacteraceae bacterium]